MSMWANWNASIAPSCRSTHEDVGLEKQLGTCTFVDIIITLPHLPNKYRALSAANDEIRVRTWFREFGVNRHPLPLLPRPRMPYATNFDLDNFLALQPLQEIAPDGWSAVPIIYDRCATSPGIAKPTNSLFTVPPPIGPPQDALLLDDTFEERLHVSDEWVYVLSRLDMARQMPDQPLCRNVVLLANQGCGTFIMGIWTRRGLIAARPGTTSLFRFIAAQEARTRRPVLYLDNMEWWFCVFDARQGKTRVFTGDATTGLPITRKALDWVLALVDFHHVCKYECTTRLCGNGLFVVHLSKSTDNYASDFLHSKHSALIHVVDPPGFADSLEMYVVLFVQAIERVANGCIADVAYTLST